jgi:hypothetical protein
MIGSRDAKLFHTTAQYGSITGVDEGEITGNTSWRVRCDDNDEEYFDLYGLVEAIRFYSTLL